MPSANMTPSPVAPQCVYVSPKPAPLSAPPGPTIGRQSTYINSYMVCLCMRWQNVCGDANVCTVCRKSFGRTIGRIVIVIALTQTHTNTHVSAHITTYRDAVHGHTTLSTDYANRTSTYRRSTCFNTQRPRHSLNLEHELRRHSITKGRNGSEKPADNS